ncbi:MAG: glycosyltransferase family 4 protein [Gammaproteobacteria bacterium]|nr:glycosyltransferase family 4 protein [Gammaproteobacteria bacterium]
MGKNKFKIAFDARWTVGSHRGMGKFARFFMKASHVPFVGVCSKAVHDDEFPVVFRKPSFFPYWEQKALPDYVEESGARILVCPYNTGPVRALKNCQLILVVHDLIFMEPLSVLPPSVSIYQNLGRIYRRWVLPKVLKRADKIVAVSEYTRQKLIDSYQIPSENITVLPNTIDKEWFDTKKLELKNRKKYLLCVAGEAPSKNLARAIEAFSLFSKGNREQKVTLKIAGVAPQYHNKFYKLASEFGVSDRVELLERKSNDELKQLYQECRAFFFPSLFEGFGIPLLEAMASGSPIVCSNSTAIPEVVGDAGLLVDPLSINEMAMALDKVVFDNDLAANLIMKGDKQVLLYHPDNVNSKMKDFWQDTLE